MLLVRPIIWVEAINKQETIKLEHTWKRRILKPVAHLDTCSLILKDGTHLNELYTVKAWYIHV